MDNDSGSRQRQLRDRFVEAQAKLDQLTKLVDDYDLDKHRVGSDLLASHYMKFWREVAKVVRK